MPQYKRSPHPGVVLAKRTRKRDGVITVTWRARYRDPDTLLMVWETLEPTLSNATARKTWAKQKSEALSRRRAELASGAPIKTHTPIENATDDFITSCKHRLRTSTVTHYGHGCTKFRDWAVRRGIHFTESLTPPELVAYREHVISERRRAPKAGGTRGTRATTGEKRSPESTNTYLRTTETLLLHWRSLGLTPTLHRDDISESLKPLRARREPAEFLRTPDLQLLLEAAVKHDTAMYTETRDEHAGRRPLGTTPKHTPIAPFVAFMLLSGCRRSEGLSLRWPLVHLDATDREGRTVGEIRLPASITKTHQARTIGLEVSPGLHRLLSTIKPTTARSMGHLFCGHQPYTVDLVETARARLMAEYGAPKFSWQVLRSTCATFLTNAPGIWGAATVFLSARQLGHSVAVAEKHYLGEHRGVPREARTLEAAMGIDAQLEAVTAAARPSSQALRLVTSQ